MIKGTIDVKGIVFQKELNIIDMSDSDKERAVNNYIDGLRVTILTELQLGDYK